MDNSSKPERPFLKYPPSSSCSSLVPLNMPSFPSFSAVIVLIHRPLSWVHTNDLFLVMPVIILLLLCWHGQRKASFIRKHGVKVERQKERTRWITSDCDGGGYGSGGGSVSLGEQKETSLHECRSEILPSDLLVASRRNDGVVTAAGAVFEGPYENYSHDLNMNTGYLNLNPNSGKFNVLHVPVLPAALQNVMNDNSSIQNPEISPQFRVPPTSLFPDVRNVDVDLGLNGKDTDNYMTITPDPSTPYTNPNNLPRAKIRISEAKGRRLSFGGASETISWKLNGNNGKQKRPNEGGLDDQNITSHKRRFNEDEVKQPKNENSGAAKVRGFQGGLAQNLPTPPVKTIEEYGRIASKIHKNNDQVLRKRKDMAQAVAHSKKRTKKFDSFNHVCGRSEKRRKEGRVSFGGTTTKEYDPREGLRVNVTKKTQHNSSMNENYDALNVADPCKTKFSEPYPSATFALGLKSPKLDLRRGKRIRQKMIVVKNSQRCLTYGRARLRNRRFAEDFKKRVNRALAEAVKTVPSVAYTSSFVPNPPICSKTDKATEQSMESTKEDLFSITGLRRDKLISVSSPVENKVTFNFGDAVPTVAVAGPIPNAAPQVPTFQVGALSTKMTKSSFSVGSESSRRRRAAKSKRK
uniref:Uncharacterized protein n=1 Tax=Corethron hystrix TaxID=216773 RepID=A0A7S1FPZ8_9STRA|mmetsp:Transcript_19730/g.44807  ORF Transcript_19730/g.44807 Transcript_19730/m.44807 type:complete len:635 (+) Transcript_19730:103-2007(+)